MPEVALGLMKTQPLFADLLPFPVDPVKAQVRERLIGVLTSQGEILPSANSPRGKLWRLVNSPDGSLHECAEIIQLDSALAARIFRVANSGAYGLQAENLAMAILHLGMKFIREQVFNAGIFKQYAGWVLPEEWDQYWLRNILVARLCERIAATYGATDGSEYLAGLIHDTGWLFLATYFPEDFASFSESTEPRREAEATYFPYGHAEISAAIAARSLLPRRAIDAVLLHHDTVLPELEPKSTPKKDPSFLKVVLRLSDQMADACGLNMFTHATSALTEMMVTPEAQWLSRSGRVLDLKSIGEEELAKSQQIFEVYFSDRNFR